MFTPQLKKTGLCSEPGKVQCSIILSGDTHQLSAITKSKYAAALGYETSLMEYLLTKQRYMQNTNTGEYDPRYIVYLVKNYRNHPYILETPNELIYRGMLEAKAPTSKQKKLKNFFFYLI